ncbi:MAG TPA: glycosyltransferase family 2 protein [Vicinamibacterales bacterium]|nr:glycosyltransferase family 2 protein [Vicinamibacterales bacterium]
MPCLNEADTIETCVVKATTALRTAGIAGEVIVADNGSTDGSDKRAANAGACVVRVAARGYGSALIGGIESARGRYIIMGDADDSYDFAETPKFVSKLREGFSLVQGCRLPSGGGTVLPNAMPFLHRYFGNPSLTALARWWFHTPVHDVYCGMRGFHIDAFHRLGLRCTGMEFATEMILKASLYGESIAEVPITLHPDGRKAHPPHVRTFRDGWRTLRLFLLFSPRWLFLLPGLVLMMVGLAGYAIALPGTTLNGVTFDVHTLLYSSVAIIAGQQSISFALFTKSFAIGEGLLPLDSRTDRFFRIATLERGIALGALLMLSGLVLLADVAVEWQKSGWGPLDYAHTLRYAVPGATLTMLGLHTVFASFFVSILGLRRR